MSAKGRVLHFIDTTGPGGAETIFLQLATGLRERGWDAQAVLVGPGWVMDSARRLELPVELIRTRGRFDLSYVRRLRRLVVERGIRLIQAHLFSPAVYASAVGLTTRTPVVATFHGTSDTVAGSASRSLRYRLIDRQAEVVCVSEPLTDTLRSLSLLRPERLHVIHNGIDIDAFAAADGRALRQELGVAEDAFLVGALGNFRSMKDYPNLLRAAAQLAGERRIVFAIAGQMSEPLHTELQRLRDELGLRDRVAFWGFRQDVPEVLAAYDVLAISSSSEGFSLAAIQAMAAGTPVVATRSGGPEQIITDGKDGLLVPARSPEALAAGIRRYAEDPALRERMAAAASETVRARFSVHSMLDGYERVYERATTRARRG